MSAGGLAWKQKPSWKPLGAGAPVNSLRIWANTNTVPWQVMGNTCPYNAAYSPWLPQISRTSPVLLFDSYSSWIEAWDLKRLNARETVSKLQECFATLRIPDSMELLLMNVLLNLRNTANTVMSTCPLKYVLQIVLGSQQKTT